MRVFEGLVVQKIGGLKTCMSTLRMFENVVLRQVSGPRTYEFTRAWRNLHNECLHSLYSARNIE